MLFRSGITRVIAPRLNEQDIEDIPAHLRKELEFVFVDRIEDVLKEALADDGASRDGRSPSRARGRRTSASRNGTRRKAPARKVRARSRAR